MRSERVKKEAAKDRENNLGMNFSPRHQRITDSGWVMEDAAHVESPVLLLT